MHAWSVLVAILASVCTAVAVINAAFGYTFNFAGIAVFVFAIHITSALSAVLGFLVALNNEYFTFDLAKLNYTFMGMISLLEFTLLNWFTYNNKSRWLPTTAGFTFGFYCVFLLLSFWQYHKDKQRQQSYSPISNSYQ